MDFIRSDQYRIMKTKIFLGCTLLVFAFFSSCNSAKKAQVENIVQKPDIWNQSIKYFIDKVRFIKDGNETKVHAEFEINPISKIISLHADDPEKGKVSFETEIESIECSLNENLTAGQAVYKGYIKQDDGRKTWTSLLLEPKDGQILIRSADQNDPGQISFVVERWEIVEH